MLNRNQLFIAARLINKFNGKVSMATYFLVLLNNKVYNHNMLQLDFHQYYKTNFKVWTKNKFSKNQNHKTIFKQNKIKNNFYL